MANWQKVCTECRRLRNVPEEMTASQYYKYEPNYCKACQESYDQMLQRQKRERLASEGKQLLPYRRPQFMPPRSELGQGWGGWCYEWWNNVPNSCKKGDDCWYKHAIDDSRKSRSGGGLGTRGL